MLKSYYPHLDWQEIQAVGFDLDGTLYDEFELISQVYLPIAAQLAEACSASHEEIYHAIIARWLEKGSSYPRIFDEVLTGYGVTGSTANRVIEACLKTFRNFVPQLVLPARVATLLDLMASSRILFLVTDGSTQLQRTKIEALGLSRWFTPHNILISGTTGLSKPSEELLKLIPVIQSGIQPSNIIYFGDRDIDQDFATNVKFQFQRVFCLTPVT